jgi:hypothetical protein
MYTQLAGRVQAALIVFSLIVPLCAFAAAGSTVSGDDPPSAREREIQEIKREMLLLEHRVDALERENSDLKQSNAQLKSNAQQLQTATAQEIQAVQAKVAQPSSPASFAQAFEQYLGRYRFTLVGGAAGSFIFDRASNINTFALDLEPIILWQISDRMLFEGTVEANLPAGSSAEFQLPVADFQIFLNDYMTLLMGVFDQPFGDFYEDQSPFWVNRFVTTPLPYGVNALIPPSDVGVQLRGGFQWGALGQIADYTLTAANGPGFSQSTCSDNTPPSSLPTCPTTALVGDTLTSPNNIRLNTHTPAFGARIRVYPLPVDTRLGRLELGASTYDGKWQDGFWFNSWGVDFNYFRGNLQTRGEWIQTYRQMPAPQSADNREGWYVQAGYFLTGLHVPGLPSSANQLLGKLEPLVRYSGINQRATVQSEVITTPEIGFTGSPAVFLPHAREVALGLDYWFSPSLVWQNEFDFELPRQGGYYSDTGDPIYATANDHAFLSQFAIGF